MIKTTLVSILLLTAPASTESLWKAIASTFRDPTSQNATITEAERKSLVDFMNKTRERLLNDVKGLTPAQLNFKPDNTRWSVAECVEHIALTENTNMTRVTDGLKTPADPSNRSKVTMTDEALLKRYTDRSDKRKTGEALEPKSRFGSHDAALKEFLAKREANIEFAKLTKEDLRNRLTTYSFGTLDLYQCLVAMIAHSERHIVQLEEVKADPKFPK
jgi:hypothetical protein